MQFKMKEKLLELLSQDCELENKEIASMLDVSEKEIEEAVNELRHAGVLKKCKAVVDWKRLDGKYAQAVIQVKVVPQEQMGFDTICREISKDERVSDVYVVTGEYDLMLMVEASSLDEVSDFVTEKLAPKKEVVGTYTHIVLNAFKKEGALFSQEAQKRLQVSL